MPAAHRFFTAHQAAVVEAATARTAPGPGDDPAEEGHPGAREANVTGYIDTMLSALDSGEAPGVFASGAIDPVRRIAWRNRLTRWQDQYRHGIAALDERAGGDFATAAPEHQDEILAGQDVSQFTALLFGHTIEGLYARPEYGGNHNTAGWREIGFPGDVQPGGYTAVQVERSDGPDPVDDTPIVADVLKLLGAL